jgi:hypothetical protein
MPAASCAAPVLKAVLVLDESSDFGDGGPDRPTGEAESERHSGDGADPPPAALQQDVPGVVHPDVRSGRISEQPKERNRLFIGSICA